MLLPSRLTVHHLPEESGCMTLVANLLSALPLSLFICQRANKALARNATRRRAHEAKPSILNFYS